MARVTVFDKFSEKTKQEINNIVKKQENALDMIVNNYYFNDVNYSSNDVCNRFQVENFSLNPDENTLQTSGRDGWWQNEAYEPSSVSNSLNPLIETDGDDEKWGAKYYSSFALKELPNRYTLRYPLDDDYTSSVSPLNGLSMNNASFNVLVRQIQKNLKVKIVNGNVASYNAYKRSFPNLAIVKIRNTALKLIGKSDLAKTAFKGKLVLADRTKGNYKYNNIEKVVKIYDELFKVGIAKQIKYTKGKYKGADRDIKFASRLFADMLMSRITDFGDNKINKKVEKCLSLQFANVLNRSPIDSRELKMVTELGVNIVADTCEAMGITKEMIIQKMVSNGYQYPKIPENMKEAILLAKVQDYSVYANIDEAQNQKIIATKRSEKYPQIEAKPQLAQLKAANAVLALPSGKKYEALNEPKKLALEEKKKAGNLTEATINKLSNVRRLLSGNMVNPMKYPELYLSKVPAEWSQKGNVFESVVSKKITKKSVEKNIDKVVIKLLAEKVVSINTNLNSKRYSAVGGKVAGEKAAHLYSHVLSYYTKYSIGTKKKDTKDNGTFYSRTSQLCDYVISIKNKLVEKLLDGNDYIEKKGKESSQNLLNSKIREQTKTEKKPDGYTLRDFFKHCIEKLPNLYEKFEKIDDQTKTD